MEPPIPPEIRFQRHIDKEAGAPCWLWTGTTSGSRSTYGYFRIGTKTSDPKIVVHRYAHELWIGPIPDGFQVDHVKKRGCTSTLCVNPDHLEAVPPLENWHRQRLDVCKSGRHDLTILENVKFDQQGRRRGCRPCNREKSRELFRRKSGYYERG